MLNGKPSFAEKTRSDVLAAARDLNYIPNGNAQALRQPGHPAPVTTTLCVYISHLGNPDPASDESHRYFEQFQEMLRHSLPRGIYMVPHWYDQGTTFSCPPLESGLVAAAVLGTARPAIVEAVRDIARVVLLDVPFSPEVARMPVVNPDVRWGFRLVLEHLQELGHRRIGVLGIAPTRHTSYHASRYPCFLEALSTSSLEVDDAFSEPWALSPESHDVVMADVVNRTEQAVRHGDITALVCLDDVYADQVVHRLAKRGVSVPDDLSVTGFNRLHPPQTDLEMTSVWYNRPAMYDAVLDVLAAMERGRDMSSTEILVRPSLVTERTTAEAT